MNNMAYRKAAASAALGLFLVATGCATREMKSTPFYEGADVYTGRVEDRINLWPLMYWREPACSIAWPLISFADDHFALRPLYSQYRQDGANGPYDEFNVLWPLCQIDSHDGTGRAFPFFWGNGTFVAFPEVWLTDSTTAVLPLVMNSSWSRGTFFPLVFWTRERGERAFTLFPLYSYSWTPENTTLWGACGLFGHVSPDTGRYAHWVFPFYYANRYGVLSIPWSRMESLDGFMLDAYLCGLGGRTLSDGEYRSSWAMPFYYHDREKLITPLFGRGTDSDWIMPLYYRDDHLLFTLPYASWDNPQTGGAGFLSLPLLTYASWETNSCRNSWFSLAGLVGATSNATGERRKHWMAPFYHSDAGRSFLSLPYGWTGGGTSCTNTWWATPLVGTSSGSTEGWWAFPFYSCEKDDAFDGLASLSGETALPDEIDIHRRVTAIDASSWLVLTDNSRSVTAMAGFGAETNNYSVTSRREIGNALIWWYEAKRRTLYGADDRLRKADWERVDSSLCLWLYDYLRMTDFVSGSESTRHRVLWKLFDLERCDGNVRLDAFPGFAYDSHDDGYVKASLLWRLFRYECTPASDAEVDLLFLPVWR